MFADRTEAGTRLARELSELRDRHPIVFGLPRGGVVVAAPVAAHLHAPLSAIIVRKLGVPSQPELAFGAIAEGGVSVIDEGLVRRLRISPEAVERVVAAETAEAKRRADAYGIAHIEVAGRPVVVVDDGLATGATMLAAVRGLLVRGPERIIVAVPVGASSAIELIANEGVAVIALETPRWFGAVGAFYDDFRQTSDEEVVQLLRLPSVSSNHDQESQI